MEVKSLHNSGIKEHDLALRSGNPMANLTEVNEISIADRSAITLKSGNVVSEHLLPEANSSKKSQSIKGQSDW